MREKYDFQMKEEYNFKIPETVLSVAETLAAGGFEAFLVGGSVRDLLLGKAPKDWDITTGANPEEIQSLFPKTFYENDFGTVGVVDENVKSESLRVVEVTPFRLEGKYSDKRHPDAVVFSKNLNDDLKRRDFTINAMAYSPVDGSLIDNFGGRDDLKRGVIRTVGDPDERFGEDALRILRAIRFAVGFNFALSSETADSLEKNGHLISEISMERSREELNKIILSDNPMVGFGLLQKFGVLTHLIPELLDGIGMEQRGEHIYDVWEHNLRSLNHAASKGWPLHIRWGALLHDVGKPKTREWDAIHNHWTFHGHDVVGERIAKKILRRLRFQNSFVDVVGKLVRYHLFFSDVDTITLSAVRRLINNVGPDNVWDLMKIRACDRIGTGRPKETPYRLRKYHSMIEEATRDPVSLSMLKINGRIIMETVSIPPGPMVGLILYALFDEVLENPSLNNLEYLGARAKELSLLPVTELEKLGERGKEKKEEKDEGEVSEIRKKYGVG